VIGGRSDVRTDAPGRPPDGGRAWGRCVRRRGAAPRPSGSPNGRWRDGAGPACGRSGFRPARRRPVAWAPERTVAVAAQASPRLRPHRASGAVEGSGTAPRKGYREPGAVIGQPRNFRDL